MITYPCIFLFEDFMAYNDSGGNSTPEEMETIHARYLIACDGAHGWIRDQLGVLNEENSEESTWGVLDIVPITDFRALNLSNQVISAYAKSFSADSFVSRHSQELFNKIQPSWKCHDSA